MVAVGELKIRAIVVDEVTKPIEQISQRIDRLAKAMRPLPRTGKEMTKNFDKMTRQFRSFNASLLSVMFGSIQLSKTFDKLLSPVEDAIGLQELWNAILIENTIDAVEPTIEAMETAGEMFRYVNNVTGGTLGRMFMFGRAVGDTMSAVSQATLFLEGLVTQFINLKGGGSLAADAVAQLGSILAGIAIPIVFFNEKNLKTANAFLSDINDIIEQVVEGQYRQAAAIRSLDIVLPTLFDIFLGQKDIDEKIDESIIAVQLFGQRIKDLPMLNDLKKSVDSTKTSTDRLDTAIDETKTSIDAIKPTALDKLRESERKAKEEAEELRKAIERIPDKTIKINIVTELFGAVGRLFTRIIPHVLIEPWSLLDIILKALRIRFEHGGIVPGPIGRPIPAIVHGGEMIIPPGKAIEKTIYYNPTFNITATIERELDETQIRNLTRKIDDITRTHLRRMVY